MASIGYIAVLFRFWIGKTHSNNYYLFEERFIDNNSIDILYFRLVHDREVQLYDGTRLIRSDSYDQMIANGRSAEELAENRIFRIHPSFRIVALAEPPSRKLEFVWNSVYRW